MNIYSSVFGFLTSSRNLLPPDKCMIWCSWDGLAFKNKTGKESTFSNNEIQQFNAFDVADAKLYYFSHSKNSIAIVGESTLEHIELKQKLAENKGVESLYICGEKAFLNVVNLGEKSGVIQIDLPSNSQEYMEDVHQVKCNMESRNVTKRRGNQIYDDANNLKYTLDVTPLDWDYDETNDILVWTDGHTISVRNEHSFKFKPSKLIPLLIRDVIVVSSQKQIWASVDLPLTSGFKVLVFSYDGKLKEHLISSLMPIKSPFLITEPRTKELLVKTFNKINPNS